MKSNLFTDIQLKRTNVQEFAEIILTLFQYRAAEPISARAVNLLSELIAHEYNHGVMEKSKDYVDFTQGLIDSGKYKSKNSIDTQRHALKVAGYIVTGGRQAGISINTGLMKAIRSKNMTFKLALK